jgi:hypothetical protein
MTSFSLDSKTGLADCLNELKHQNSSIPSVHFYPLTKSYEFLFKTCPWVVDQQRIAEK